MGAAHFNRSDLVCSDAPSKLVSGYRWVPIIRPPTAGSPPGAEDDGAELTLTRMNNNTASVMELASVSLASIRRMNVVVEYIPLGDTDWIRIRGCRNPVRGQACIDG